jgi:hypothetical protein
MEEINEWGIGKERMDCICHCVQKREYIINGWKWTHKKDLLSARFCSSTHRLNSQASNKNLSDSSHFRFRLQPGSSSFVDEKRRCHFFGAGNQSSFLGFLVEGK